MLTVEADSCSVERRLTSGGLLCPGSGSECGQPLAPWGWAAGRRLRGPGRDEVWLRPRRARCRGCAVTHVLLPVFAFARRADLAEVIGKALAAKASGLGVRPAAALVGRPPGTVRGWLRRFAGRAEAVRVFFTALLVAAAPDPAAPTAAGCAVADAVAAVVGAAAAVASRWPALGAVSPWQAASAASGGLLLAPAWPRSTVNTGCP